MIEPTRTRPVTQAGGLSLFATVAGHRIYTRHVRTHEGRTTGVYCSDIGHRCLAGQIIEPKNRLRSIEAEIWAPVGDGGSAPRLSSCGPVPVAFVDEGIYLIVDAWLKTTMTDPEYQAYLVSCGPVSMWDRGNSGLAQLIEDSDCDD